jgi:hypothetical protein
VPFKVVHQPSEALIKAYGADRVMVRPDLFVAWTSNDHAAAPEVLARAIGAPATVAA